MAGVTAVVAATRDDALAWAREHVVRTSGLVVVTPRSMGAVRGHRLDAVVWTAAAMDLPAYVQDRIADVVGPGFL